MESRNYRPGLAIQHVAARGEPFLAPSFGPCATGTAALWLAVATNPLTFRAHCIGTASYQTAGQWLL